MNEDEDDPGEPEGGGEGDEDGNLNVDICYPLMDGDNVTSSLQFKGRTTALFKKSQMDYDEQWEIDM